MGSDHGEGKENLHREIGESTKGAMRVGEEVRDSEEMCARMRKVAAEMKKI
jgi:hypothetical protein